MHSQAWYVLLAVTLPMIYIPIADFLTVSEWQVLTKRRRRRDTRTSPSAPPPDREKYDSLLRWLLVQACASGAIFVCHALGVLVLVLLPDSVRPDGSRGFTGFTLAYTAICTLSVVYLARIRLLRRSRLVPAPRVRSTALRLTVIHACAYCIPLAFMALS